MSLEAQALVWGLEIPSAHKFVAMALADHAHKDGTGARPSQSTLATKVSMSSRHVRRILSDLVEWKIIEVERPSGQHRATTYRFVSMTPDRTPVSTLKKSRPDISASRPDICDTQTGHPCPTNRKEPLLEPLPNLHELAEQARRILRGGR